MLSVAARTEVQWPEALRLSQSLSWRRVDVRGAVMRVGYSQRSLLVPAVLPPGIPEYITGRRSDVLTREARAGCTSLWSVDKRSLRGAVRVRCTVTEHARRQAICVAAILRPLLTPRHCTITQTTAAMFLSTCFIPEHLPAFLQAEEIACKVQ